MELVIIKLFEKLLSPWKILHTSDLSGQNLLDVTSLYRALDISCQYPTQLQLCNR